MTFDVQAPDGKKFRIEGDHVPSEAELNQIYQTVSGGKQPRATKTATATKSSQANLDPYQQIEYQRAQAGLPPKPEDPLASGTEFLTALAPEILKTGHYLSKPLLDYIQSTPEQTLKRNLQQFRLGSEVSPVEDAGGKSEKLPVTAGVVRGVEDLAKGFTSPIGLATLGIGALPAAGQRAISLAFAAQMASQTPEIAKQLGTEFGKNPENRDTSKIANLITQGIGNTLMTAVATSHAATVKPQAKLAAQTAASGAVQTAAELQKTVEGTERQRNRETEKPKTSEPTPTSAKSEPSQPVPETTAPAAPVASKSDAERYNQLIQIASESVERGETPSPEVMREIEAIKNRHGGMTPGAEPEKIVSAAYQTPSGVATGPNHPEILQKLGRSVPPADQRNTPEYGFWTNKNRFASREESARIATAAGQNLKTFEPGEPAHSDEVAATPGGKVPISETEIPPGPGGATRPKKGVESDIGKMETNIPPLEKLTDAVRDFPKQPGLDFWQKLEQWKRSVGIPAKDTMANVMTNVKAHIARLVDAITKLPEPSDLERDVGVWDANDQEGSLNANRFAKQVRKTFRNRSKLSALSKYIEAEGNPDLLKERSSASKTPELQKAYQDAADFGPDEKRLAADIRQYFDEMLAIAQREGALEEGVENFVHRFYPERDPRFQNQMANLNWMKFTKNFAGFKKRFYATDFEAEQAGLKPESDIARRILAYDQGFRRALTARAFVKSRYAATLPDGRPELDVAGMGTKVGEPGDTKAVLIKPKWKQNSDDPLDYRGDYVPFDHPAFKRWKFATTDTNGKPILTEGDVLVHPDAVKKYQALFEKSWWSKGPVRRAALKLSSTVKQTMLDLSGFHPFQIAVHAAEHRVNPFKLVDLNPADPAQRELMEGGLSIADTHGEQLYSEGVYGTGLTEKIPVLGEQLTLLKDAIFKDFIPRIKMTMAQEALRRNLGESRSPLGIESQVAKDFKAGKLSREQVVRLTARESNAAFGEQNYRALFRHKSFQDTLRFLFLAPDFGEARIRFPLQALTKYGAEQRQALILGAAVLFTAAKLIEHSLTGQNHWDRPFTVTYKGREYGIRNVASDLYRLVTEPNVYLRNRLNPIYTRAMVEFLTGRDTFGRKRTMAQQLMDEAKTVIPISTRGFGDRMQQWWEQFANAMGITERQRTAYSDIMKKINDWKQAKGYESPDEFVYDPDKDQYAILTHQLILGSDQQATAELNSLIQGKAPSEQKKIYDHYKRSLAGRRYLTGSKAHEKEYLDGLSSGDRLLYDEAMDERREMWQRFQKAWENRNANLQEKIQ